MVIEGTFVGIDAAGSHLAALDFLGGLLEDLLLIQTGSLQMSLRFLELIEVPRVCHLRVRNCREMLT